MHMPNFFQPSYFIHYTSSLQAYSYHKSHYTRALSRVLPNSFSKVSPNSLRRSSRLARDISLTSDKFSILETGGAGGVFFFHSIWHPWLLVFFWIFFMGAVGTCSPGQVDPTGEWKECKQGLTRDGDCSVNPASLGHYTGVFIGAQVSNVPM
jgi:hypothetical protein